MLQPIVSCEWIVLWRSLLLRQLTRRFGTLLSEMRSQTNGSPLPQLEASVKHSPILLRCPI
ncbi:DUF4351 domain-containing protein [Phormidium sp. CLA17]|uniref:DUF4351 domain-containing protein n=1 Tax=Leptolyngbya sp. Cla-17 TaxID=2803751 RepID=UPI001490F70B|nr:DUF4351 domain-containing protein [Leptolyngbya sp. Cla-17]MBM0740607.1 DUF4351 domain-containing protein [Leptolyngbya sp. Cla-17]